MTPDGNIQFNGEPADYFSLNPMPVIILSSNAFIQYRNEAAVKWIDSKPEATREADLRNIRQMAASVLKSGTSGEVQIGPPEDCTCFMVVPEKHSGTVCFQAMPASSQNVRPKTTPVASTDSAEHFHDGFRSLIENSLQGILIHRDWQPIFANDALARIFGYPEANAILELDNVRELYAEHERDRLKMFNKTRLAGGEVPEIYEFEALRADGTSIWIQTTVRVVNWNGERATQHWFIDVTECKRAEQRLARLASYDVLTGLANRAMF